MPDELALVFQALGHETLHVTDPALGIRGRSDGDHVRHLADFECKYLATLDQFRQMEVWPDVYTAIAEGTGRVIRITPQRRIGLEGPRLVAWLTRYLVDAFDDWSPNLDDDRIALIDLGRARDGGPRGIRKYSAFTRAEVGELLQQQLSGGDTPRLRRGTQPRRGRS